MLKKRERVRVVEPEVIWRRRYSGPDSHAFWKAINAAEDLQLYSHACTLQDIEHRVLINLEMLSQPKARKHRA